MTSATLSAAAIPSAAETQLVSRPATFNRDSLSVYLDRSLPALDRDLAAGRIPPGFRLGRARRWLRSEVDAWLQAGAPDAEAWAKIKKARMS
jgi:predicted DNA-binding transcriptional regulator AlpA